MMEEMMKKMSILERAQASQSQTAPQNRNQNQNQNFRRNQPPNRPMEDDHYVTPPFHQNYVSEVEETNEIIEEDDINMLAVDNDDFEIHYDRKKGLYTPYDDRRDDDENYYQDMENVIIEPQREYDLRRKTSQQTPNTKTSDKYSQKNTVNKPKVVKQKEKTVAVNSDKGKEKDTQNKEKQSADTSSTNTSASTPVKTIFSNVNRTIQQANVADRLAASKAETSSSKNQISFSLDRKCQRSKSMFP